MGGELRPVSPFTGGRPVSVGGRHGVPAAPLKEAQVAQEGFEEPGPARVFRRVASVPGAPGVLDAGRDPLVTGAEMIEQPKTTFADLGGVDEQIELLTEALVWPLTRSDDFKAIGIEPPKGVLLVGPPGCGKTMMAKALASLAQATFIRFVGSELAQKYIGEGGRLVRELFDLARTKSPSIVFIDEIDAIGARRLDSTTSGDREVQRTLMQLLAELDGFEQLEDVKIIAATNRPDILDDALLRPGRFDRVIEIPLPNIEARTSILKIHLRKLGGGPPLQSASLQRCKDS